MRFEHTDKASVAKNSSMTFADLGEFVQDTWNAPDKRLKQTLAVGSAMLQGGCKLIVEEAQHHPEQLAQRAALTLGTGALFGAALACEIPVLTGVATVGGAVATGLWLGEIGRKLYTDTSIRKDLDSRWKTGSLSVGSDLQHLLGADGRDLMFATTFGAAGVSAGARLPGLIKSIEPIELPSPGSSPAFATAGDTVVSPRQRPPLKQIESKNALAMSAIDNSGGSSRLPNKDLLDDIATIKDSIGRNELDAAEDRAFFGGIFIEACNNGVKELKDASRLFSEVAECFREAGRCSVNRKDLLIKESLKRLDQLEKIDVERALEKSFEKELEWLRESQDSISKICRDKEPGRNRGLDELFGIRDQSKIRSVEQEEPKRSVGREREERDYDRSDDFGR